MPARHALRRLLVSYFPAASLWAHQGIAQRVPDCKIDGCHLTVADLDHGGILRKPVLGGLINEYVRAA